MMRRLHASLDEQPASPNNLGNRIRSLNVWLQVFTVAILASTIVQALTARQGLTK
jgi:hypothetical protein